MILKNVELVSHDSSRRVNIEFSKNIINKITECKTSGAPTSYILPGYFDTHTHGGYGFDFNDFNTQPEIGQASQYYLDKVVSEGVTNVMATTVTCTKKELNGIATGLKNLVDFYNIVHGWHIEGPFISKEKKGAHDSAKIIPANVAMIEEADEICKKPKIIVIAPEIGNNIKEIQSLSRKYFVAIGHTNATADQTLQAMVAGANRITHFYNQVSKFDHRNPGVVNAGFLDVPLLCELICDGIHVNPLTIKNTFDIVGPNRIMIVSDSLGCKGLPIGKYSLGGLEIDKHNDRATLHNSDTLAGSVTKYDQQVRIFKKATNCSMSDIVKVTSYNAWKSFDLHKKFGIIAKGKPATFIEVDKNLNVQRTFINGDVVYKKD